MRNGGVQHDADHEWITFNRMMLNAIDAQKKRNAKSATEQQLAPWPRSSWHAHGDWGAPTATLRTPAPARDLCDGFKCPHKSDAKTTHAMCLHSAYHSIAPRKYSMILLRKYSYDRARKSGAAHIASREGGACAQT